MKRNDFIILSSVLSLLFVVSAYASGGGGGEASHGSEVMGYVWKVVNFAILVAALVFFARKPFKNFLRQRAEAIEKTLNEARQARELAEKALKEVEERLRYKDKELAEIVAEARLSGETEREAITKEAEKLAQKTIEQAKSNIEYELKQAKAAIKEEAVMLAMELAEKKIKEKLGAEEHKKLFEESLLKLEGKS